MADEGGTETEKSKNLATMDDLKQLESSMMSKFEEMMTLLQSLKPNPMVAIDTPQPNEVHPGVTPAATTTHLGLGFVAQTSTKVPSENTEEPENPTSKKENGGKDYSAVPPPLKYTPDPPIPMPHIIPQGAPPMLDTSNFANWQYLMRSHISSSSIELMRIVEDGFSPFDPKLLTRGEVVDKKLNATALGMIQKALTPKDFAHIRQFDTAKGAWDQLTELFVGNASIQSSKFDEVNNEWNGFSMQDDETPEDMYRRLKVLCCTMRDLGATYVNDKFMKRKFIQDLLPFEEQKLNSIKGRTNFHLMTSQEVLSEVIAMTIAKKNAESACARAIGSTKVNLALKAKAIEVDDDDTSSEWSEEDLKCALNEHLALASRAFWNKSGFKSRSRDNSRFNSPNKSPKARSCYNCNDKSRFVVKCPFENREDNGGRLICKIKSRPPHPLNKNYVVKNVANKER